MNVKTKVIKASINASMQIIPFLVVIMVNFTSIHKKNKQIRNTSVFPCMVISKNILYRYKPDGTRRIKKSKRP